MKIRWLEYFIAVAEDESVTRATLRLNTSQAALSRVIRELEQSLGVELFQRTGRGMKVTAEGAKLLVRAREVTDSFERFMATVDELKEARHGSVRIVLPMRLSTFLVRSTLEEFDARHPNASIEFFEGLSSEIQHQLRAGQADIGLYYSPLSQSDDMSELIGTEALYLVGPVAQLGTSSKPISVEEAAQVPLLMQSPPAEFRHFVETQFQKCGYALNVVRNLNTIDAHLDFARSGDGATVLAYSSAYQAISSGSLIARKIVNPEITRQIYIGSASQATTRLQRDAIQILKRVISQKAADLRWSLR